MNKSSGEFVAAVKSIFTKKVFKNIIFTNIVIAVVSLLISSFVSLTARNKLPTQEVVYMTLGVFWTLAMYTFSICLLIYIVSNVLIVTAGGSIKNTKDK